MTNLLLALLAGTVFAADEPPSGLAISPHFIAPPEASADYGAWLAAAREYRRQVRRQLADAGHDFAVYERSDLAWAAHAWACHFTFLYDRSIYDPQTGRYTLDDFLDDGRREFEGYQAIVLWHAYPRLGFDQRNQFDMYRDMPGGLEGLRSLVRRARQRGVKVFVDYNPWDFGTRREDRTDVERLVELVAAIEADGIFLDTLAAGDRQLRQRLDQARPGVVLEPELYPADAQLAVCNASWAQWLDDPSPPGLLRLKWIEPRHMQHQIRRWDRSHRDEIETAFFNGSGVLIWENIFGVYNPWNASDRRLWRQCAAILNHFPEHFADATGGWQPFYPTLARGVYAHRWGGGNVALFTLRNTGASLTNTAVLAVPQAEDQAAFDLFRGREIPLQRDGQQDRLVVSLDRLGCVAVLKRTAIDDALRGLLVRQQQQWARPEDELHDDRNAAASVIDPVPVERTRRVRRQDPPPGMVLVPGGPFRMQIEHRRRECGCYPDPGTPPPRWHEFLGGNPHHQTLRHDIGPLDIEPFFIDEAEVTNGQYARFVAESGYQPKHPENFLKHWPGGTLPGALAEHPAVYVDLDDARAFARWAGKRLPTEAEWQLAAQGTDGRRWPWGDMFDAQRCSGGGPGTQPVRSLPGGRSPYGCYHMSGNVWEWTESERDDGHTRFVMIRGGSYYRAEGSVWYADGGPQPCGHHAKFLRMWPGLDRCATIGFRCVVDIQQGQ